MDTLTRGLIRVGWVYLDEGWNGYYNEEDPNDQPLLRFDVHILKDGEWVEVDDASYCTRFPAHASTDQREAGLRWIMDKVYEPASSGSSIKKICERLSWITLQWLEE